VESEWKKQNELDDFHSSHPRAGDVWSDWERPIYLVVQANEDFVYIRHSELHKGHWGWSPTMRTMTIKRFKEKLQYKNGAGYWAHVRPAEKRGDTE